MVTITTSMTNNRVWHAANNSKRQQQRNVHGHVKNTGPNNRDRNNRNDNQDVSIIASWITILVNVVCRSDDTTTTKTKVFATCLLMVDVVAMKTITIRKRIVNGIAVMLKMLVVCHQYMDNVKKMKPVGTSIDDRRSVLNSRSAVVVATRIISTLKENVETNAVDEALLEKNEHRHRHIVK